MHPADQLPVVRYVVYPDAPQGTGRASVAVPVEVDKNGGALRPTGPILRQADLHWPFPVCEDGAVPDGRNIRGVTVGLTPKALPFLYQVKTVFRDFHLSYPSALFLAAYQDSQPDRFRPRVAPVTKTDSAGGGPGVVFPAEKGSIR